MGYMATQPTSGKVNAHRLPSGPGGTEPIRVRVGVEGIIQGVGFRPFVYRLATDLRLTGWVRNTSQDVQVEIEGPATRVREFILRLHSDAPALARIQSIATEVIALEGSAQFEIRESWLEPGKGQMISPDVATCLNCLAEVMDRTDRRYRYPFTNCTDCGPRFTIIRSMPYDRPNTTMSSFVMCAACQAEYDDPGNRRFHAQPNACPVCGPSLDLRDATGQVEPCEDALAQTAHLLADGQIVALKGLGGFLLACDATNPHAVQRLRERKRRPSKPFAVMLRDIETARLHCALTPEEETLLLSSSAPIVLAHWNSASTVCREVAPGLMFLGIMLPYTPLHHVITREVNRPLVMTSGNLSEEPIAATNEEALSRLRGIADSFLLHDRPIHSRYDDSVAMVVDGTPHMLRRARGYAPDPINLAFDSPSILAVGPQMKSTFCLSEGRRAFVSQHIGDLDSIETLENFEETIDLYQRLFHIKPEIVAHDLHPDYASTIYARQLAATGLKSCAVQHHHAHIAGCMAENSVDEPVIGVAFDGSGLGSDGHIWGGEFLVSELSASRRAGHLEYLPLPGGDAAIIRPYRTAAAYVATLLGQEALDHRAVLRDALSYEEQDTILKQMASGLNTPLTSSMGRLFDAVAALTGIRSAIDYDGQAAIELEMTAHLQGTPTHSDRYQFGVDVTAEGHVVRIAPVLDAVLQDVVEGIPRSRIAIEFHAAVARITCDVCVLISRDTGLSTIALSGGVFQNRLLLHAVSERLRAAGFRVLTHIALPPNDACVSLGQAVAAAHQQ